MKIGFDILEKSEHDIFQFQTKIAESRDSDFIFKHFERANKESSLAAIVAMKRKESRIVRATLDFFNKYFQPVYSPTKDNLSIETKSVETNLFSFSQKFYSFRDKQHLNSILTVYAEMAKAFDKVPHLNIMQKSLERSVLCLSKYYQEMRFVGVELHIKTSVSKRDNFRHAICAH